MGERELRAFVEAHNARLVGRSSRELAERFGLSQDDVRAILVTCPEVREHPKGLWSYLGHIEPSYKSSAGMTIQVPRKPKTKLVQVVEPLSETTPAAALTRSLLDF